ncbi:DUF6465 family protein [Lachnoclostridium sp. An181]|uniref:DUF6465 family protein n=1 Tax=Lachnoclostridium sp. An181 TaxID=1965575 RepID=UPI000B3A0EC7|nr:DUF6465 family protein [Lachnoclostridium sp. An181]OUP49869.1 hypothetical protein B5F18_06515 [Lachnoclostridium sp. An181]
MATKRQMKKQETKLAMGKTAESVKEKVEEVKEAAQKAVPEVKAAAEKATASTKAAAVKAVAETKKTVKRAATKKEIKQKVIVEYQGKQVDTKDMIAAVKKVWTKGKNKVSDIKSMDLYVKPEDNAVYYVINGTDAGHVEF